MDSDRTISVGTLIILAAVVSRLWQVYRYIGSVESKIERNLNDVNKLGESVRGKINRLVTEIRYRDAYLSDIEKFLEKEFSYLPHTRKDTLSDNYRNEDKK